MSIAFQLVKPRQHEANPELYHIYQEKQSHLLSEQRTTHHIRSTNRLTPLKSPSVTSLHEGRLGSPSARIFLSPGTTSDHAKPSEAIYTLKGELIALKQEISKLLTEEDKQKLIQRKQRVTNILSPRYQRSGHPDIDIQYLNNSRANTVERSVKLLSGQQITSEKGRLVVTENETLKQDLKNLQAKYAAKKTELNDQNQCLRQKILSLEKIISTNQSQVAIYKADIDAQLGILKSSSSQSQNTQKLQKQIEQNRLLKQEIDRLYNDMRMRENQVSQEHSQMTSKMNMELERVKNELRLKIVDISHIQSENLTAKNEVARLLKSFEQNQREVEFLKKQSVENNNLKQQVTRLEQLTHKTKIELSSLEHVRNENENLRRQIDRMNITITSLSQSESESTINFKRENALLREELNRMKDILTARQIEYETLAGKYYEQINQASSRHAQSQYSSAFFKGEFDRVSKSLSDKEVQIVEMCNKHRIELQKLEDTVNYQREQLVNLEGKLFESEKSVTTSQNKLRNSEHKDDSLIVSLKNEVQRISRQLKDKENQLTHQIQTHNIREQSLTLALQQLQQQPVVQTSHLTQQSARAQQLEAENMNLRSDMQYLQDELSVMKNNSKQSQKLVDQINKCNEHYQYQISSIRALHVKEIEQLNQSVEDQRKQATKAYNMVEELNKKLQSRDEDMSHMRNQMNSANAKWYELSAKSGKANRDLEQIEEKLELREEEIEKFKTIVNHLENQVTLQNDTIQALEQKLYEREQNDTTLVYEQTIKQQQGQITNMEHQLISNKETIIMLNQELVDMRQHEQDMQSIVRLKSQEIEIKSQELELLSIDYKQKLNEINSQRERWKMSERNNEQSKVIAMLEHQLKKQAQDYDSIIGDLQKELQHRNRGNASMLASNAGMATLDEALHQQFDELSQVKKQLEKKNQETYKLKDQIASNRSEFDNLRSEFEMQKLKHLSERKNVQVAIEIDIQNIKNDLVSERRVNQSISQKLKYLNQENKKKDGFIQTYIVGKKLSQDDRFMLKQFFDQYSIDFPKDGLMNVMYSERNAINELTTVNQKLQEELQRLKSH